jgi:pimeloyl-ACP methyl ester carboxylesterase
MGVTAVKTEDRIVETVSAVLGRLEIGRTTFALIGLTLATCAAARAAEPVQVFIQNPTGIIRLPDGRRLAYAEYGDPAGEQVIIHHHGFSSCRLEAEVFLDALRQRPGVRMFAIDRPGIGQSDPNPCLSFLTWPADLAVFADALQLQHFALTGVSGGAPYALAAARAMPDRVTAVSLACPVAPFEAVWPGFSGARGAVFAQRHPVMARVALGRLGDGMRNHPDHLGLWSRALPGPDRELLRSPMEHQLFLRISNEAYRQGPDLIVQDGARLARPWACWLKDVYAPVTITHGTLDSIAPPAMGAYLARALPNARAQFFAGEAHMSLPMHRAAEILAAAAPQLAVPDLRSVAQGKSEIRNPKSETISNEGIQK